MFSFSFWTVLRIIFSILFTITGLYIYRFLNKLSQNEDCPLADGWRVSNGLMLSVLLSVIGAINIIIPASKFLASLPIIGSGYVLLFFLALFMLIFLLNRICINIDIHNDELEIEPQNSKCYLVQYSALITWFSNRTIMHDIYITIAISMLFFYL